MDEGERQRKLEAGRAKLASYRQKRSKGDGAGAPKKTQKRKGQNDAQNDGAAQDRHIDAALPSASGKAGNMPEKSEVEQNQRREDQSPSPEESVSPVEDFREEELVALTGKEQLKKLQQAVEKRNEIIARLSSNLQEALASRDQVQLEAQSLAGQIQALQRQLQQTSEGFLRLKTQSGADVPNNYLQQHQQGHYSQDADINQREAPSGESTSSGPGAKSSVEGFGTGEDGDTDNVLRTLRAELEEERKKSQHVFAELAEEMAKHQHVLFLLEKEKKGREEEQKEREAQLQDLQTQFSSVQSQCLELQQYKAEKEKLNAEMLDLRKRLQEGQDAQQSFREELASSALCLQNLEEERRRQEMEMQKLREEHREEVQRVRQLLEERERELKFREEEVNGLKASKNLQNQAKAGLSCNDLMSQDGMNVSIIPGDIMMERYLSSAPRAHSQSSVIKEGSEHCGQLDISADFSFELNSEVLGDEPLLSISNRYPEENDSLPNNSSPRCSPGNLLADDSLSQFLHNSTFDELETSKLSEQEFEEADLEKELLSQQCGELREELVLKDRDLEVLREEVVKSAEELEEARSRWAQVTEELRQALWELDEEKEKRREVEEEMNSKSHEQDNLKNKLSALMEERENEKGVIFMGQGAAETSLPLPDASSSEEGDKPVGEQESEPEKEAALQSHQKQQELLEWNLQKSILISLYFLLKAQCDLLMSELEETKTTHRTAQALLDQRTMEWDESLKELKTTRAQVLKVQTEVERLQEELKKSQSCLDIAEKEKSELESQIFCLIQNLTNMEEAQAEAVKEREENGRKREDMDEQIRKMEQVLEEELEQFENLLKDKDDEISELNTKLESELLKQQVVMEEEQKRQISLIKQVTEREHERMISELTVKHNEELNQLRTELSMELRESLEAAHQAELQQAQTAELEALRLSLTSVHMSQLEHSKLNLEQEQESVATQAQTSLRDTFAQEGALLQAQHQLEMDRMRQQDQKQQDKLRELHQQHINELTQQGEATKWEKEAESTQSKLQETLSESQNSLTVTQTELATTQASLTHTNKALTEAQAALSQMQSELRESSARLEELQTGKEQNQKLEEELRQAWNDRDAAARALEELVSVHKAVLQEREQQALHLQEQEQKLQQKVVQLQKEKTLLKQSSEEEVGQLWSQLESMRTSRQELGELKEQLLARSARVDDIERLKSEFNDQKREIKEQNEAELESLRRYFEQRLQVTEESYREEIALLQLRLVESALEESVLTRYTREHNNKEHVTSDADLKQEKQKEIHDSLCLQLEERHTEELSDLRSSMAISFKKELQQVRSDLTDFYYAELQEIKTRHALELEQLRAKLSDTTYKVPLKNHHVKSYFLKPFFAELTKVHSEAARQVEVRKINQIILYRSNHQGDLKEKHDAELSVLKSDHDREMEKERRGFEEALHEEREKLKSLQAKEFSIIMSHFVCFSGPQVLVVRQRLEAQYDSELQQAKSCMTADLKERTALLQEQSEERLRQALDRKRLSERSQEMETLDAKHKAQLDSLSASHKDQLEALTVELESKHNAELVALDAALDSKLKAELEALEAELAHKHQEERDELEKRMLGNMDTLEATYLKEVQTLRDEMMQIGERHRQELNHQKSEHRQLMARQAAEQLSIREELRKELAQVHLEKFSAMAAELSLNGQKLILFCCILCLVQVLELEQQHSTSLQELSHTLTAEREQLIKQHHLQLQELRSVSARELEACRRELEEESSRHRQHFLEEVELLKVQSEERLQDRINQLKTESEEQKQAELEDLRRSFTSEQEEKERSYTGKMSQLTAQLQQLDTVVSQLRAEVGCLQGELEGKRAEMDTLDTLLQRRERESQEGGNHLKMLTDDLQTAKEERCNLHQANEKLRKVLIEMIRCTIATEELIGQKISARTKTSEQATHQRNSTANKDAQQSGVHVSDVHHVGIELTHLLCESLLVSDTQINPGGEEAALSACSRLRHTVDTLLELLNQANTQLEQTHGVHLSLEDRISKGRDDSTQLLEQHKLLLEQLDQEARHKSKLQLELHKAEGLLEGYVAEKAVLEESLQQKEAQEERLVEELEDLKELSEEHALLMRQKEHLSAGLGEREKGERTLLEETERLAQDRLDLQRQAEKDHSSLSLRLRALERELEDQETKELETEQHHKTHTEDLHQRVQALEKQLKHDRQFIEEQAVEREHERDEFQQEIRRLEAQLRHPAGVDNKGHRVSPGICFSKRHFPSLSLQQAQRDLAERNEEIDKLAGRIRELEQALLNSAESTRSVSHLEQELHRARLREQELSQDKQALEQQQLSNRLQISALQSKLDETRHCYHDNTRDPTQELRDALDTAQQSLQSKEQEVSRILCNLEKVQSDLNIKEVELKHLTLQLELLTNQNAAHVTELQEQIAALKLEEGEEVTLPSALLQEKNEEIDHLNNEIQRLEQDLESTRDNKVLEAELEDLRSQVEHLKSEIVRVREDKQEEEERLHEVISTLQAELATLGPILHEVSDSQDGDSINPSPAPSPEPRHYPIQERRGGPSSLKQELSLTRATSSRPLRSRLKALQSQLDTAVAEKDGLERLLLTQEEEYRGHGEEFGKRLKAEWDRADKLQELLTAKEADLQKLRSCMEDETEKRKLSEEERDTCQSQAQEMSAINEKNAELSALILELQTKQQDSMREITALQTKKQELNIETEALRETSLTLERQVQEVRFKTLETAMEELSAECEVLRRREGQLQEEIERLRQEATSMRACIQNLTFQLNERETSQEDAQKEVLTHAELTLAKADAALRQKEAELARLKAEHQAQRTELTTVKQGLSSSTKRAEKLHVEGQTKDRALVNLDTDNQHLKAELRRLQEDLAVQEEELAYQQRELQQLRHHSFEDGVSVDASLSSPEVLRRHECSEDRIPERFHTSVLGSRLSEISALNSTGLDIPPVKLSPRVVMEPPLSRTITPDPVTQSTHSPGSMSDNLSMVDSMDTDKVNSPAPPLSPPSPLGSTSSMSAPEWASDGYGSNVSSELGARLRVELEQTERLDAQFVEYLRCRGINPTANTDSAAGSMSYSDDLLSPELQALLKKVYQESCRILTLSQHKSSFNPPMSWQQEKRALQDTVIALRELLCRMAQRHSQVCAQSLTERKTKFSVFYLLLVADHIPPFLPQPEFRGDDDWQRDQLRADGQVEYQLRAELEERQKHLKCAHDTQQEQKNKIQSLRYMTRPISALNKSFTQVLHTFSCLFSINKMTPLFFLLQAAKVSSEQHRSEVMALRGQVDQEKVACSNLRKELQIEQSRSVSLSDAHRRLDEERGRCSRQVDELSRRHEADEARDRKFISDLRAQLEQERRQGEELAAVADKLRAELLQSRRRWEEKDRIRREELQKEQEAAVRQRVAIDTLRDQKQEAGRALEAEREQTRRQGVELGELKERLRLLKDKEREWEEKWERERRKGRQEQMERERRQETTNNKLCELELLRQQDQQRMQELQHTLSELQREEREMAAQRLSGRATGHAFLFSMQTTSSPQMLERLLEENLELTERVTSLSQERATLKHRLTFLERELRRTENELAKVATETENRPLNDVISNSKVQRLYERYLRAESFRKALVYQKRYLLLLLGGFQECEQATLCLIAHMGARPSPPLSSQRRPLGRFRAAVRVVIAVSRMRFLTKKWNKAIRRLSTSGISSLTGPKAEVLRQQHHRLISDSPPDRDSSAVHRDMMSSLVPPTKSPFRLHNRSESYSSTSLASGLSGGTFIQHLEKVQERLVGAKPGEQH
uniref:Pericentrin n=1 Tax=Labrus bergylta TaxID=56723 RepID=A0A3Q3MWM4_9LABR